MLTIHDTCTRVFFVILILKYYFQIIPNTFLSTTISTGLIVIFDSHCRFETDQFEKVPYFLFGDFNFRLDLHSLLKVRACQGTGAELIFKNFISFMKRIKSKVSLVCTNLF